MRARLWLACIAIAGAGVVGFALASGISAARPSTGEPTSIPETSTTSTSGTTGTRATTTTTTTTTGTTGPILPNPTITPGVLNRAVRQSTIRTTICRRRWTKKIRPPLSYTNKLKRAQMVQYGEPGSPADYEEDHLIPLELGGAPRNPKNLWPEPRTQARVSDPLETSLKRKVCRALMTLKKARATVRAFKFEHG